MHNQFVQALNNTLSSWNVSLPESVLENMWIYHQLLYEVQDAGLNLTAIERGEPSALYNFADALSLLSVTKLSSQKKLVDIGSGSGFPGLALAIACPEMPCTLVDAQKKKVLFMQKVVDALSLNHVQLIHARAEDIGRDKKYREQFDIVVSRAVALLPVLAEYMLPLCVRGGDCWAYKGSGRAQQEWVDAKFAIRSLGGVAVRMHEIQVGEHQHVLVHMAKKSITPVKYPRKAGLATRQPLIKENIASNAVKK